MTELIIFVGIPGAGKTTHYINNYLGSHMHINLDTIGTRPREMELYNTIIKLDLPVVIDNTNLTAEKRARYINSAKRSYDIKCIHFKDGVGECIPRNLSRERVVPDHVIYSMNNSMETPHLEEGFSEIITVKNGEIIGTIKKN